MMVMFGVMASFPSCSKINQYFGLEDDNLIEQMIETLIDYKTGFYVDLTPGEDYAEESGT